MSSETEAVEQRTTAVADEDVFYLKQGEAALEEALKIVESEDGWKLDTVEVIVCECKMFSWCADLQNVLSQEIINVFFLQKNGDVIYSKVLTGNRKVFRLEAELNASPEELHDILFFRVEEMHEWNPSIRRIKVRHVLTVYLITFLYYL